MFFFTHPLSLSLSLSLTLARSLSILLSPPHPRPHPLTQRSYSTSFPFPSLLTRRNCLALVTCIYENVRRKVRERERGGGGEQRGETEKMCFPLVWEGSKERVSLYPSIKTEQKALCPPPPSLSPSENACVSVDVCVGVVPHTHTHTHFVSLAGRGSTNNIPSLPPALPPPPHSLPLPLPEEKQTNTHTHSLSLSLPNNSKIRFSFTQQLLPPPPRRE